MKEKAIKRRFELVAGEVIERTQRLVAASEAVERISAVSRATGLSRKAISFEGSKQSVSYTRI